MFDNNADIDFGDEFTLDLSKAGTKRPSRSPLKDTPKKQKLFPPPIINPVKRKFPGPAGILPDRKNPNSALSDSTGAKNDEEIPCSPMTLSAFHGSPWINMSRDFEPLVHRYDIRWIKTNIRLKKLQDNKAPFLAAVIKNVECYEGKIVKVVLKDATGEIQGTILSTLYERYSDSLVVDSVIVLRQCGVTNCSNNQYLSIIPNNLVSIYCQNNGEVEVITVQKLSCNDLMGAPNGVRNVGGDRQVKENRRSQLDTANESVRIVEEKSHSRLEVNDEEVWKNALEGIDIDSFLEDF